MSPGFLIPPETVIMIMIIIIITSIISHIIPGIIIS